MLGMVVLCVATTGLSGVLATAFAQSPIAFVSAPEAATLVDGGATVLDARARGYVWGHLPAARPIDWQDYRDGWGRTGRLDADLSRLERKLEALGVDGNRPVLVYGDVGKGYGEEGRIAWMLAYLGHPRVAILDGGIASWRQAGRSIVRGLAPRVAAPAKFVPSPRVELRADKRAVMQAASNQTLLLDVRSREEFFGATPYLEARGGHIPGAAHLDWHQLLDENGKLREKAALQALVEPLQKNAAREVIVYCTGGVRSAFVVAALRSAGFAHVRNYDGSFWEWAADSSLAVELPPKAPR